MKKWAQCFNFEFWVVRNTLWAHSAPKFNLKLKSSFCCWSQSVMGLYQKLGTWRYYKKIYSLVVIKNTKDSKKISYSAKKTWRAHLEDVTMDKQELYQHLFFWWRNAINVRKMSSLNLPRHYRMKNQSPLSWLEFCKNELNVLYLNFELFGTRSGRTQPQNST